MKGFPRAFSGSLRLFAASESPPKYPLSENEGEHARARWRPRRGVGVHRNGGWIAGGFRRLDLRSFRRPAHGLSARAATKIIADYRRPGRTGSALQPAVSDARLANAWTPNNTHMQHRAALGGAALNDNSVAINSGADHADKTWARGRKRSKNGLKKLERRFRASRRAPAAR